MEKKKGRIWFLAIAIVAVLLVVLKIAGIFPKTDNEVTGTIGGVQKVDRYRGEQLKVEDLNCGDPEVTKFMQSAEFQNLIKDENLRGFWANPAFVENFVLAANVLNVFKAGAADFSQFLNTGNNAQDFFGSQGYSDLYQALKLANDANGFITPGAVECNAQDLQKMFMNADFQKYVRQYDFSQNLEDVVGSTMHMFMADAFNNAAGFAWMPEPPVNPNMDFQALYNSAEFQKLVHNQDLQKFWGQDFQKMYSQDFQKWFNQDFQKMVYNQDFQKVIMGTEFQNALKNMNKRVGL